MGESGIQSEREMADGSPRNSRRLTQWGGTIETKKCDANNS